MSLQDLFKKTKYVNIENAPEPEHQYTCPSCNRTYSKNVLKRNIYICPFCKSLARISSKTRLTMIADAGSFEELFSGLRPLNPIDFEGYEEKVKGLKEKYKIEEAVLTGRCKISGQDTCLAIMDSRFIMASMGSVVGEKLTRLFEYASEKRLPVVVFCASGGARMQEGIFSLMQMAKVSAAVARHSERGLLYISVLTDPTTGGVTASFASLADVILAEPSATIGFAGRRVIEGTIKEKLAADFQTAEFMKEHGFVDFIAERHVLKRRLAELIAMHGGDLSAFEDVNFETAPVERSEEALSAFERLQLARDKNRPNFYEYVGSFCGDFIEMSGDRLFGEDAALAGGIAMFEGRPVTIIGTVKGKDVNENVKRRFGMPNPEGYRKAKRLMEQAEKFGRPIICLVDTSGAYCGVGAEERGQGEAIAKNLFYMSGLTVPVISVITGEGGSGGALGLAVANKVYMLENAVYSVISAKGFASILWKDAEREAEAAERMKMTAYDLLEMEIIDAIVPEPAGGAQTDPEQTAARLGMQIASGLKELEELSGQQLADKRYERFRKIGIYEE